MQLRQRCFFILAAIGLGALSFAMAEPNGSVIPAIVGLDSSPPAPFTVDTTVNLTLDLVPGQQAALPEIESLRLSLYAVGGPLSAPLVRDQALDGTVVTDGIGSGRYRFRLPTTKARPGAILHLLIHNAGGSHLTAETWLKVAEPFDAAGFRLWAKRHAITLDPALTGIAEAFRNWKIPQAEAPGTALAILGSDAPLPQDSTFILMVRRSKDGRMRLITHASSGGGILVDATLPNLTNLVADVTARQDFLIALRECASLLGDDFDLPAL